jgi:UDP-N-acetylglucosamine--N-acetylmuramyl-(pentapeptide) pyrophosphoryl-undecaprenol N-acetylglucosamine transferase
MAEPQTITKTIMLSGGGSGGPVTPLLVVAEELLREPEINLNLIFVGTKNGPERVMVEDFNHSIGPLQFIPIVSGKWRRYFSLYNIVDIFKVWAAFLQSLKILAVIKPDIVISAGAFVSVPLVWAAKLRGIPVLIHQQDVRPGLANKLMAAAARAITVTFEKSLYDYPGKAILIGNPVRLIDDNNKEVMAEIRQRYNLSSDQPLVLITGGGTGAVAINDLVGQSIQELGTFCQIIHLTGKGKAPSIKIGHKNYHALEFVAPREFTSLVSAADLVVSRCGMAALTELSAGQKAAILIPMPDSHQTENAAVFAQAQAALVLEQQDLTPEQLVGEVRRILDDPALRTSLQNNIGKVIKRGAAAAMAGIIWEIVK